MTDLLQINLPDGSLLELDSGCPVKYIIDQFDPEELQGVIGIKIGDQIADVQAKLTTGGTVELLKLEEDSPEIKHIYRHSLSHIMAEAVKRLFPNAKLAIGPSTADGFYYDFDVEEPFTPDDLKKITAEIKKIFKANSPFERFELSVEEAREMLNKEGEVYKLEMLEELAEAGETISFYRSGEFVDMCSGPHLRSTGQVRSFKLLDIAGAYWRGDENNKMLQRIYGTAFLNKEDLKNHLWQIEEAKKRDHRKLGKELDLYSINQEDVGSGLILWHPKGALIRHIAESHCKDRHLEDGYDFVISPHIGRSTLWETSGHLDFYREGMYAPLEIDEQEFFLKPMNCPFHCHIYKNSIRSYRDLPLRWAEWGTVYRYERSGTLHGLTRVRGFTQDDAHLFCREDQMPEEIDKVLEFSLSILKDFGFKDFHLYLSTRPEKCVGREEDWDAAEDALKASLERSGLPYSINEADGAFYGPKIDICLNDALKREWQLSTIQFDFNLPERFDLNYVGEDGKEHRPFMIHRALLGSLERFFALLIEHHGGIFPVWLAPTQAIVLPIVDKHHEYSEQILEKLKSAGIRASIDGSSNTLNYRIRGAQKQKIPFMLILGDQELESNTVTTRLRTGENLEAQSIDSFLQYAAEKISSKESI